MILRNHSCGHHQLICPRCFSTGCDSSNCNEAIGNNSSFICKNCGCNDVISMEIYQSRKTAQAHRNIKTARDNETRIKNLETATKSRYSGGNNYQGAYYHGGGGITGDLLANLFTWKALIIGGICYGLTHVLHYGEFTGIVAFLVAIINIIGGIVAIVIGILLAIVNAFV